MSGALWGQTKKELQAKRSKLLQQISVTSDLIKKNQSDRDLTLTEIQTINKQIKLRQDLINNIDAEKRYVEKKIKENHEVVKDLEESLENLKDEYSQLVYLAYKNRNTNDQMMYLFASESFYQAIRRMQFLKDMTAYRKEQGELIIDTKASITKKLAQLEDQKKEKEVLLQEAVAAKREVDKDLKLKEEALAKMAENQEELTAQLDKQKKESKKLQSAIKKLIEAEIAASRPKTESTNVYTATPEEKLKSSYFSKNKGKLPWPVLKGVIVGKFGTHPHASMRNVEVTNNGIDIATDKNALVRSMFGGEVSGIISIPGAGQAVVIKHGEYRAVYSNLLEVMVEKGQNVETKEDIGVLMTDGNQSVAHLEIWKITKNGMVKEDPASWIAK